MLWPYIFFVFVAGVLVKSGYPLAAGSALLCFLVLLALDSKRAPRKLWWIPILGLCCGVALYALRIPYLAPQPLDAYSGEGEVLSLSRKSIVVLTESRTRLRLTGITKENLPAKHARVAFACNTQNVDASTFRTLEQISGVAAWCKITQLKTIAEPQGLLYRLRARTLDSLQARFALIEGRSLIAAFLLGDTENLTAQELDAFRGMGLMHLFAVSGLNIALLFGLLYIPFRAIRLPAVGSVLGYTVATAFLLLLDFPVPLLRAWLFMSIALVMRLLDRRIPSWILLFATAVLIELLYPLSSFSLSFLLSFGVTAAILVFYEPLRFCFDSPSRVLRFLGEHTALTLAAGLSALLLGYVLFGAAHPLSLVYNLLLVPFSGIYLFLALLFLIFPQIVPAITLLDALYLKFAEWHANYIAAYFPLAHEGFQIASLFVIACLLAALYYLKVRHRLWSARRNVYYIIPVTFAVLVLPYFMVDYPQRAFYAVPNKVWLYQKPLIQSAGETIFQANLNDAPRLCFPVHGTQSVEKGVHLAKDILALAGHCFIFSGRMQPELWPANVLQQCQTVDVFQSRKSATSSKEWLTLFEMFGYRGITNVRRFFTWYGDKRLECIKEIL